MFSLSMLYNMFIILAYKTIHRNKTSTRTTARNKNQTREHFGLAIRLAGAG